jgi:Rod binding domain-containing protein
MDAIGTPIAALDPWNLSAQQARMERLKAAGDQKGQLEEAARGFENILVRKWIEVARKASILPKDSMMSSYQNLSDDQLAAHISNQGGFGFADAMVKQMMSQIKGREALLGAATAADKPATTTSR